jgi:hypothetical protein
MTRTAPLPPLFSLQLEPGRRVWEHLPCAATLTVTEGSIVVHERLWLADTWVHLPVVVRAGGQFCVGTGGWVEMEAVDAAQVHACSVQQWRQVARLWWTRVVRVRGSRGGLKSEVQHRWLIFSEW